MKESEPKVVEIIPILKGLPKAALSYFYRGPIEEGEFVNVEVRSNPALGIVSKIRDARSAKTDLKKASFTLKKLRATKPGLGLSPAFLKAAETTAEFYAATTGAVLGSIIPKFFLNEPELISFRFEPKRASCHEPILLQLGHEERFASYKSIIRECLARKSSILFITPTNEDAHRAYEALSPGIEDHAFLFTLDLKKKDIRAAIAAARSSQKPILFVTTAAGIIFDRPDLGTVIVERENSRSYRTRTRPYISAKAFIEHLAREAGKDLILGDTVLSLETLWNAERNGSSELFPLKWRVALESRTTLVDMKGLKPFDNERFEIFSPELKELMKKAQDEKQNMFLFGVRKGLSPSTVCGDCGHVLACQNCGAPIVLHRKRDSEERIYLCHACGAERNPETRCDHCSSWKLIPLGIGIDRIAEETHRLFPKAPLYIFDRDHVESASAARALVKKIHNERGAIVIGTELFFLYAQKIPYAAIVTLDSLFAIPDFGVNERIFSLVSRIRELSRFETLVQTRNIGKDIIDWATRGNILDFYRKEMSERTSFLYPPASIFIKVQTTGLTAEIETKASELRQRFAAWGPEFLKGRKERFVFILSMIIRVKRSDWPQPELVEELRLLGREFSIKVDPESIL